MHSGCHGNIHYTYHFILFELFAPLIVLHVRSNLTLLDLPVGFLLLQCSVSFTVEYLSLLISLLYLDLYVLGDDALIS